MADHGSLYTVLRKAKPLWSQQEIWKVHQKLGKIAITDAESLSRALEEDSINAALTRAGERKLKKSTIAHLKVEASKACHTTAAEVQLGSPQIRIEAERLGMGARCASLPSLRPAGGAAPRRPASLAPPRTPEPAVVHLRRLGERIECSGRSPAGSKAPAASVGSEMLSTRLVASFEGDGQFVPGWRQQLSPMSSNARKPMLTPSRRSSLTAADDVSEASLAQLWDDASQARLHDGGPPAQRVPCVHERLLELLSNPEKFHLAAGDANSLDGPSGLVTVPAALRPALPQPSPDAPPAPDGGRSAVWSLAQRMKGGC